MSRFQEFDFTHGAFLATNPEMQKLLLRAYKSKMTCSQFIEEVPKTKWASRTNHRHLNDYTNAHKISDKYFKLDSKFNFFGNYEE